MKPTDVTDLDGKVVLVCSSEDHRNPPTGRRGTLYVRHEPGLEPVIEVELEFPQMFSTPVHRRRVQLGPEQVAQVLASNHEGTFAVTLPGRLDPEAPVGNE